MEGLDLFLHEADPVEPPLDGLPPLALILPPPILQLYLSSGDIDFVLTPLLLLRAADSPTALMAPCVSMSSSR
eukprot:11361085-Alexandrium_andersonii.AAC.1